MMMKGGRRRKLYAIDKVKDEPHGDAELFKIEIAIVVDVGDIPDPFELVVTEVAVLEDGRCLRPGKVGAAVAEGREEGPVLLHFPLLDLLVRHDAQRKDGPKAGTAVETQAGIASSLGESFCGLTGDKVP